MTTAENLAFRTFDRPPVTVGKVFVNRRALKLMTHEAGHVLSIAHCVTYRCVMQGSNTLEESDGHPLHLCPLDLRKLEWNTGVDLVERYRKLRAFFLKAGWLAEAR